MKIADKVAEISEGRRHTNAVVRVNGTYIGRFGIRRGKKGLGHDFIPKQIGVNMKQALELGRCTLDSDDYERILRERGKLPDEPTAQHGASSP